MSALPTDDPVAERRRGRIDTARDLARIVAVGGPARLLTEFSIYVKVSTDTIQRSSYHTGCAEAVLAVSPAVIAASEQLVAAVQAAVLYAEMEAM